MSTHNGEISVDPYIPEFMQKLDQLELVSRLSHRN